MNIGALVIVVFVAGLGLAIAIGWSANLPTVYVSNSTGACVRVEGAGVDTSCEDLPGKYHHVWVR